MRRLAIILPLALFLLLTAQSGEFAIPAAIVGTLIAGGIGYGVVKQKADDAHHRITAHEERVTAAFERLTQTSDRLGEKLDRVSVMVERIDERTGG